MKPKITLIRTLLPIKGLSHYCQELLKSLSKNVQKKRFKRQKLKVFRSFAVYERWKL